jgi:hypothetical protein
VIVTDVTCKLGPFTRRTLPTAAVAILSSPARPTETSASRSAWRSAERSHPRAPDSQVQLIAASPEREWAAPPLPKALGLPLRATPSTTPFEDPQTAKTEIFPAVYRRCTYTYGSGCPGRSSSSDRRAECAIDPLAASKKPWTWSTCSRTWTTCARREETVPSRTAAFHRMRERRSQSEMWPRASDGRAV